MDDLDILDITNNYYKSFFDKSCRSLWIWRAVFKKSISTICVLIANICLGAFSEINMNRNTIVIGLALMIIIFIFSHCYLKNKVSKIVRVSFETVSYTHLDVYKRQVEFNLRFCTRRTNANPSSTFKFIVKNVRSRKSCSCLLYTSHFIFGFNRWNTFV